MPLLGFDSRFSEAIENGSAATLKRPQPHPEVRPKRQTIRARRADGHDPKPGDTLYLYTGLRTKSVRKLGEVRCRTVERLRIGRDGRRVDRAGCRLDRAKLSRLARADGFEDADEFIAFFESRHGLPFDGYLIRW